MKRSDADVAGGLEGEALNDKATSGTGAVPSVLNVVCPYCLGKHFVKRGTRKKKFEIAQLYLCRNPECGRTFTAQDVKGKRFPIHVIIEGLSYYNLGCTLEDTCKMLHQKFHVRPEPETLSGWVDEYKPLCRYELSLIHI